MILYAWNKLVVYAWILNVVKFKAWDRVSPRLLTVTDMFRSWRCDLISVVLAPMVVWTPQDWVRSFPFLFYLVLKLLWLKYWYLSSKVCVFFLHQTWSLGGTLTWIIFCPNPWWLLCRIPGGKLSRLKQGVLGNPVEGCPCPDRLTDSAFDLVSNMKVVMLSHDHIPFLYQFILLTRELNVHQSSVALWVASHILLRSQQPSWSVTKYTLLEGITYKHVNAQKGRGGVIIKVLRWFKNFTANFHLHLRYMDQLLCYNNNGTHLLSQISYLMRFFLNSCQTLLLF